MNFEIRDIKTPSSQLRSWVEQLRVPIPCSVLLCIFCPPIQDWSGSPIGAAAPGRQGRRGPRLAESSGKEDSKQQGFRKNSARFGEWEGCF